MTSNPIHFAADQVSKGILGGVSTLLAVVAPWQERVDWYLDAAARLVGLGIGLAVLASIVVGIVGYIQRH